MNTSQQPGLPEQAGGKGGLVTVDLDALAANYRTLAALAAPAACAAVVKANAYGLGLAPASRALAAAGCRHFFVANLDEGEALRQVLPEATIYVLNGISSIACGRRMLAAGLVPVINSLAQLDAWSALQPGKPCVLHIDTGMNRLGMSAAEVAMLGADSGRLARLQIACVMTHLACADEPARPDNARQLERFHALRSKLPEAPTSIANSAGVLLGDEFHGDLVRPGIGLYGGAPAPGRDVALREVVALFGHVLQIREVSAPASVGYGATWSVEPPARLATLGLGYADGYPRVLGNVASALVGDQRVPVVGRVSMDSLIVDISTLPEGMLQPGDRVQLLGGGLSLEEVAGWAGTISYELLTGLGRRLEWCYSGDSGASA